MGFGEVWGGGVCPPPVEEHSQCSEQGSNCTRASMQRKRGGVREMGNKVLISPYWPQSKSPKALDTRVSSLYDARVQLTVKILGLNALGL